jgi:nucleotidyltransferase/DNA polymerase involved in DNA repair
LWGIGAKTARRLTTVGIGTVRELAAADPQVLAAHFGPTIGPWLVRLARSDERSPVVAAPYLARSRGREVTYQHDVDDWDVIRAEVVRLARQVAEEIAPERRPAIRVIVKVRYAPFFSHTRGQTLAEPTAAGEVIAEAALAALDRFSEHRPVRLLGVRAELAR